MESAKIILSFTVDLAVKSWQPYGLIAKIFSRFLMKMMAEKSHFVRFEAINIAVAPIIAASVVAVKGDPIIFLAATNIYANHRSPTAKTAVRIMKGSYLHAVLAIHTVFRGCLEIVSAPKIIFLERIQNPK